MLLQTEPFGSVQSKLYAACDALYNLEKKWYYVFLPFEVYQQVIDIMIRGCDVAGH